MRGCLVFKRPNPGRGVQIMFYSFISSTTRRNFLPAIRQSTPQPSAAGIRHVYRLVGVVHRRCSVVRNSGGSRLNQGGKPQHRHRQASNHRHQEGHRALLRFRTRLEGKRVVLEGQRE